MSKLTIVAEVRANPGKEKALHEVLVSLLEPSRHDAGCLEYELHVSHDDPGFFVFYENWESEEHWQAHMQTPHLAALGARREELIAELTVHKLSIVD